MPWLIRIAIEDAFWAFLFFISYNSRRLALSLCLFWFNSVKYLLSLLMLDFYGSWGGSFCVSILDRFKRRWGFFTNHTNLLFIFLFIHLGSVELFFLQVVTIIIILSLCGLFRLLILAIRETIISSTFKYLDVGLLINCYVLINSERLHSYHE